MAFPELLLLVNGGRHALRVDPEASLLSVLREDLDLTGAKYGCGEGQCGACTVLVDGKPIRSCLTRVSTAAGKPITTVEGLAQGDRLHPVQQAFLDQGALQCGYCTSGMIVAAAALLAKTPRPSDVDIGRAMEGHICRCGTYGRIVDAVRQAAETSAKTAAGRKAAEPDKKAVAP